MACTVLQGLMLAAVLSENTVKASDAELIVMVHNTENTTNTGN